MNKELCITHELKKDFWTLLEAFGVIKYGFSGEQLLEMSSSFEYLYDDQDFDLVLRSIESGKLKGLNPEFGTNKSIIAHTITVKPLDFLKWCNDKEVSISERVTAELSEEQLQYISDETEEVAIFKNVNQRHRERCRTMAEYFWQQELTLTIEDMIQNDAINGIACEKRIYSEKTLRNWIKDLCPNRKPGRRPKN